MMTYSRQIPPNKRPCPNHDHCKRYRKAGEIFCHACYFRLPKEYRDLLWARNIKALQPTIDKALKWLKADQETP